MTLATARSRVQTHTAEAYLAAEVQSELRHEYRDGEIIPMTGGTPNHNRLSGTLLFLLMSKLRKQPYDIFVTDQRLWIPERNMFTYPDVMVMGRPAELMSGRRDTVVNPLVVAEVLSSSTEGYDRGETFSAYRTIPSFQEYLLVAQDGPVVERYEKRSPSEWVLTEWRGMEAVVPVVSLGVELPLVELYEAVEFGEVGGGVEGVAEG